MALLVVLAVLLAACAAPTAAQPKTMTGVLLDVRSSSISKVDSLKLRSDDGQVWSFTGGDALNNGDPEGSPGHLRSHMAQVDHVTVVYHETSNGLVADQVGHA
jgi:hypothetical protein